MPLPLKQRTAVITGAASGIGKALAKEAADQGMMLALVDANTDELNQICDELSQSTEVISAALDVRKREQLDNFAIELKNQDIAVVFANAGVMRAGTSWKLSADDWDLVFDVNVKGVMHTISAFMPHLIAQTSPARIVITGSTSAFMARPHLAAYSSSKHALWGIAEALQLELAEAEAPVDVSFLAPSGVKTPIASRPTNSPTADQQKTIGELLEAFGMPPEEVAEKTFAALKEEKFWILPQPEFKEALIARAESVTQETNP